MIYALLSVFIIISTVSCCNAFDELFGKQMNVPHFQKTSCRTFRIAYLYAHVRTTGVKNSLRSRGNVGGGGLTTILLMMVAATRKRARFDGEVKRRRETMVESLCRNKGGTISRMRSTFSTNAGSQAVKQIRPSYIRGVPVIPRARLWPPSPSPTPFIPEEECRGVKSTSLPIRMEVMCCVGSETLSWHPAGNRFS